MTTHPRPTTDGRSALLTALGRAQCRSVVVELADRTAPTTVRSLARDLAARDESAGPGRQLAGLRHVTLPRLAAAELLEYDPEPGSVDPCPDALARAETVLETVRRVAAPTEQVLSLLAVKRRRAALAALADSQPGETVSLNGLAVAVTVTGSSGAVDGEGHRELDAVRAALHHVHLPKLAAAGAVDYDADRRRVTYRGHAAVDLVKTGALVVSPDRPEGETTRSAGPISDAHAQEWTLTERDEVFERQRALFDHADEELFVLLTAEHLLPDDSTAHLADAVHRGVDVTVATASDSVREQFRAAVPGISVVTPTLNWGNQVPGTGDRIGCLVVADRRAVLLATEAEESIVGRSCEGTDHPLVGVLGDLLDRLPDDGGAAAADSRSGVPL